MLFPETSFINVSYIFLTGPFATFLINIEHSITDEPSINCLMLYLFDFRLYKIQILAY